MNPLEPVFFLSVLNVAFSLSIELTQSANMNWRTRTQDNKHRLFEGKVSCQPRSLHSVHIKSDARLQ
jgi:hypothetical protein